MNHTVLKQGLVGTDKIKRGLYSPTTAIFPLLFRYPSALWIRHWITIPNMWHLKFAIRRSIFRSVMALMFTLIWWLLCIYRQNVDHCFEFYHPLISRLDVVKSHVVEKQSLTTLVAAKDMMRFYNNVFPMNVQIHKFFSEERKLRLLSPRDSLYYSISFRIFCVNRCQWLLEIQREHTGCVM